MNITTKDLGKIVDLSLKPDWGPGIITEISPRFAFIIFQKADGIQPKRYSLVDNPLTLATQQDEPDLVKRARRKNRKIKVKKVVAPIPPVL
jgi:hypothetical protein